MDLKPSIRVQVCYARPGVEILRDTTVPEGASIRDAILASGVHDAVPEVDLDACRVGIHGKLKTLDTLVRFGDRIEIYRTLIADPKESRRSRAEKKAGGAKKA